MTNHIAHLVFRYFTYYPYKIKNARLSPERCGLVGFNVGQACFNLDRTCVLFKECLNLNSTCRSCRVKKNRLPALASLKVSNHIVQMEMFERKKMQAKSYAAKITG